MSNSLISHIYKFFSTKNFIINNVESSLMYNICNFLNIFREVLNWNISKHYKYFTTLCNFLNHMGGDKKPLWPAGNDFVNEIIKHSHFGKSQITGFLR